MILLAADALPLVPHPPSFHDIYAQSMRSSLFTGFLTLSSFLLATKTLLIIQFRKDVFELDSYLDAHRVQRPGENVYESLERLASLLNANILLALTSSALQFSLGFVDSPFTTAVCLAFPAATIGVTVFSVVKIRKNLRKMFVWLNAKADSQIKVLAAKAADRKAKAMSPSPDPPREAADSPAGSNSRPE